MLKMYLNTKNFLQMYLNTKFIDLFKYFCKYFFILFSKYRLYSFDIEFVAVDNTALHSTHSALTFFPVYCDNLDKNCYQKMDDKEYHDWRGFSSAP